MLYRLFDKISLLERQLKMVGSECDLTYCDCSSQVSAMIFLFRLMIREELRLDFDDRTQMLV